MEKNGASAQPMYYAIKCTYERKIIMLKNAPTKNPTILAWLEDKLDLVKPDKVVWIDGSREQTEALRAEGCSTGEMIKLNQELLPDCYLHRTAVNDVARVEARTFICTRKKEDAGNINNWIDPVDCYERLNKLYRGSMKGRTMYVIPYSMGIVGSAFAKYGIELTDSIYGRRMSKMSSWMKAHSSTMRMPVTVKPRRLSRCSADLKMMDEPLMNSISRRESFLRLMTGVCSIALTISL